MEALFDDSSQGGILQTINFTSSNVSSSNLLGHAADFANMNTLTVNGTVLKKPYDELMPRHYTDQLYLLVFGIMILFMDLGFGLIEAGSVRTKNTTHILIKNILDSLAAGIAYWLFGFALAFGKGNEFMGWTNWAMSGLDDNKIAFAFYQAMFASTATTIVAGAVSERCEFIAYLIYSFILTGLIYPVVTHWGWDYAGWLYKGSMYEFDGQLVKVGYEDFGGSGLVHLVGGTAALVATCFLGPRIGRFNKETGKVNYFKGHSVALQTIGIFVLLFGFMALNAAAQHHISHPGDAATVSLAVFNTLVAASIGGFTALITHRIGIFGNTWNIHGVINGAFVAMVAICGGCNSMRIWGAAIVGLVAPFYMKVIELLLIKLKIDDPVNAVGIHFGGGSWGAISVAFLKYDTGILLAWNKRSFVMLGWQMAGVGAVIAWTGVLSVALYGTLKLVGIFRVSEEVERKGLDISRHHQQAYPHEAYGYGHLHIVTAGENGKLSSIEQGYVNKVFVTYEGHELHEAESRSIRTIHSVPSIVEMESMDTEVSDVKPGHKVKALPPLTWKGRQSYKNEGKHLGEILQLNPIGVDKSVPV